jgi:hypothetical protein
MIILIATKVAAVADDTMVALFSTLKAKNSSFWVKLYKNKTLKRIYEPR